MRLVDAVYARTEELLKEKCITMYKLCIEGGIPYSTLATMRNSKTVTLATVYGICQGFKFLSTNFSTRHFLTKKTWEINTSYHDSEGEELLFFCAKKRTLPIVESAFLHLLLTCVG